MFILSLNLSTPSYYVIQGVSLETEEVKTKRRRVRKRKVGYVELYPCLFNAWFNDFSLGPSKSPCWTRHLTWRVCPSQRKMWLTPCPSETAHCTGKKTNGLKVSLGRSFSSFYFKQNHSRYTCCPSHHEIIRCVALFCIQGLVGKIKKGLHPTCNFQEKETLRVSLESWYHQVCQTVSAKRDVTSRFAEWPINENESHQWAWNRKRHILNRKARKGYSHTVLG